MRPLSTVVATLLMFGPLAAAASAQDAESCGVCHRSVHQDWLQSRHSLAWKSENFQAQMQRFGSPEFCGRCHAARTIWEDVNLRGREGQLEAAPAPKDYVPELRDKADFRKDTPEDGVTCGSCHFVEVQWPTRSSGEFLGPYHSEAGHAGKKTAQFESYALCGTCHGRQRDDYLPKSPAELTGFHHLGNHPFRFEANQETPCGSCHMPRREERLVQLKVFKTLPARQVGEHTFSGNRYQQLADALTFSLERSEGGGSLVVTNAKLGHVPRTSAETHYRILLSNKEGETSQTVEFSEAAKLEPGQSLRIPLEFAPGKSVHLDFLKRNEDGFEEKLFSKIL